MTAGVPGQPDAARDLSLWLTGGLGLTAVVAVFAAGAIDPAFYERYVNGELGVVENLQALILFAALVSALALLAGPRARRQPWLRPWLGVIALGLLYVLGEEISWGQHYFRWATTGWFELHNDQGETNLHNMTSWLDQKPRSLLIVALVIGGLIHPALRRWRGRGLVDRPWWLAPTGALVPLVVLTLLSGFIESIDHWRILPFHLNIIRSSELQELLIYGSLLAYLASLARRLPDVG